jgi:hypothetical protein
MLYPNHLKYQLRFSYILIKRKGLKSNCNLIHFYYLQNLLVKIILPFLKKKKKKKRTPTQHKSPWQGKQRDMDFTLCCTRQQVSKVRHRRAGLAPTLLPTWQSGITRKGKRPLAKVHTNSQLLLLKGLSSSLGWSCRCPFCKSHSEPVIWFLKFITQALFYL